MALNREQVAERLGEYYSAKFTRETGRQAEVWSYFDEQKRAYVIRGENLPSNVDASRSWSLLDYIKPARARLLVTPPANKNY
jgi:hypothetical protein